MISQPVTAIGTLSYVLDVHMIKDQFLAILMKASLEPNDEFVQQLEDSGGLVCIEHKQGGKIPEPIPEMLYLARAAADDEREIKSFNGTDAHTIMSTCPIVSLGNILAEIKAGVKLQPNVTCVDWLKQHCKVGLQDFTIRQHAYHTRDMRNKAVVTLA